MRSRSQNFPQGKGVSLMAYLEQRGDSWRIIFSHKGRRSSFSIPAVSAEEANAHKADAEERLRLLKRGLIDLNGFKLEDYLKYKGRVPDSVVADIKSDDYTLGRLESQYMQSAKVKRLDEGSRVTLTIHWRHLMRAFGPKTRLSEILHRDLQDYITSREHSRNPPIQAETIQKELKTLRAAWNWARRMDGLGREWPGYHLVYQKTDEPLPFMTLAEAERLLAGMEKDDRVRVYESIYLLPGEIDELLKIVDSRRLPPWVYPMFLFAAHTGARKSEMLRAQTTDVNIEKKTIMLREKKRIVGKRSTREVPLTDALLKTLLPFLSRSGAIFRGKSGAPLDQSSCRDYFHFSLRGTRFAVLRGWHVFRHSFISALASAKVDQRVIDDLVGHSTEEQRRRYRHLQSDAKAAAVLKVFEPPTV